MIFLYYIITITPQMSYKTISDRQFQLVPNEKLFCIRNINLPEELIRIIIQYSFIHYFDVSIIKFAEWKKKRISNIFYAMDSDNINSYWYKRYCDDICTIYMEGNNCLKCGEFVLFSYSTQTQANCSLPICNCVSTNNIIYPPYGNYEPINSDIDYDESDDD